MEKIRVPNVEYEIVSIKKQGNYLKIEFPQPTDLTGKNLSVIELYTAGGVKCTEITGYKNIKNANGNVVTLCKDGDVYTPDPANPGEPSPSAIEIKLQEIDAELDNLSNTIVLMTLV